MVLHLLYIVPLKMQKSTHPRACGIQGTGKGKGNGKRKQNWK